MFASRPALSLSLALLLSPAAWAFDVPPPAVSQQQALSVASAGLKIKIGVAPIKVGMLPGDEMGYVSGGLWCGNRQPLQANDAFIKNFGTALAAFTIQQLKHLGYPLADLGKTSAFDTDVNAAPDFRIGAVLKEMKVETCGSGAASEGWFYLKLDWALYSEREQKVVYQRSTEGLATAKDKVPDLPKRALVSSLDNFLAAPEVLAALSAEPKAETPVAAASAAASAPATAVAEGTPDAARALVVKGAVALSGGAQKNQAKLRDAVVTLETAGGTGSGFYIAREGYLLTDFHVIKGAKYAKVKLQNGDKLVAQIVKVNERNDVALLKTPAVDITPLAIRAGSLDIGEDVYAIGSPLGVLTSTLTKGVLSADRTLQGVHLLQSDAAVTFGNSGGPLLDPDGRVIGLTRMGINGEKGLNFFTPIQDALRALDLSVTAP